MTHLVRAARRIPSIGSLLLLSLLFASIGVVRADDGASADAHGLTPLRLYYQIGHPVDIHIAEGEAREIVLLEPDNTEVTRATVTDGDTSIDLAEAFGDLFEMQEVRYAQLLVNGEPVGSALVLQPLIDKYRPVVQFVETANGRTPMLRNWTEMPPGEQVMCGFRIYTETTPTLKTTEGDITLVLRPDEAPDTAWNFQHLVEGGFYTHIPFHRIVEKDRQGHPFVIQAGDPSGTGSGGCAYEIDLEPSDLPHDLGVISMARRGDDLNSASSQFFICLSRAGTSRLDGQYCSFGQTIEGIEVVEKLARLPVDQNDRPLEMAYINEAELTPASPRIPSERPSWMGKPQPDPAQDSSPGLPPGNVDR